jgi:hypothetical protein
MALEKHIDYPELICPRILTGRQAGQRKNSAAPVTGNKRRMAHKLVKDQPVFCVINKVIGSSAVITASV